MSWAIFNDNNRQWGQETYPTEEAARAELRSFFRGVSGVRFERFSLREVADANGEEAGKT